MRTNVTVVDYGVGNLWSVQNALRYLGVNTNLCADPDELLKANSIILPGVGSFGKAIASLANAGLDQAIIEAVKKKGTKILGVCLGMQLLGISSTEEGEYKGLGLINGKVEKFSPSEVGIRKVPHIGYNSVFWDKKSILFKNLEIGSDFYFVHSYRMLSCTDESLNAFCNYGVDFLAAYEKENIFATQFHPEKSHVNGIRLLRNFLEL